VGGFGFLYGKEREGFNSDIRYQSLVTDVKYKRKALELGVSYFTILDRSNATYFHVDGGVGWGKDQIRDLGRLDSLARTRSYDDRNLKVYAQSGLYTGAKAVRFGMVYGFNGQDILILKPIIPRVKWNCTICMD
jgi:outer membrane protein assembly factor BamB